jgi:hypothetical protein
MIYVLFHASTLSLIRYCGRDFWCSLHLYISLPVCPSLMFEHIFLKLVTFLAFCMLIFTLWLGIKFDVLKGVRIHKSRFRSSYSLVESYATS